MISSKKHFFSLLVILLFLSGNAFSLAVGLVSGITPGKSFTINGTPEQQNDCTYTLRGSLKGFRVPFSFSSGVVFGTKADVFSIGLDTVLDYNFLDKQIYNTWNVYAGAGINGNISYNLNNTFTFGAGPRFFVGTDFYILAGTLEPFLQLTVNPAISYNTAGRSSFDLNFPIELGLRFNF